MNAKTISALTALILALSAAHAATLCSGDSAATAIDLATGIRQAKRAETIRYSAAWETAAGATAVVAVNGETLSSATGGGRVEWVAPSNGTYTLTHRVFAGSEQVGETLEASFVVDYFPATPTISPMGGVVAAWPVSVMISCATDGATIHYTTDGTEPTEASPVYRRFRISERTVVKAIAIKDGLHSEVAVAEYAIGLCADPVIAAASSFTGSETKVELSCATDGARIYYTLDGRDPNASATPYAAPFYVADSCTVKAYATCADYLDSAVATQSIEKVWGIGDTLGAPDHAFTTGGDLPFVRVTDATAPLGESMKSGAITHKQTSTLSTTVMGPGTISFQWKTSCEKDPDDWYAWDHAEFSLDGTVVVRLDGESGWQTVSQAIAGEGTHTLEWRYVKDDVESEGEDCCWVADYQWTSAYTATQTTPAPVPYVWLRGHFPHTPDEYDAYESAAKEVAANGQNTVWECYVAGLNPTDETVAFRTVISIGADGEPVIGWEPKLSAEEEAKRTYTIYGRESLTDGDWGPTNAASRFFRVKVSMP